MDSVVQSDFNRKKMDKDKGWLRKGTQKFARNCSKTYRFRDIRTFQSFVSFRKIQIARGNLYIAKRNEMVALNALKYGIYASVFK